MTGSHQGSFLMHDRYKSDSRFTCTTNLTHGGSRSPLPRYGRHFWPRQQLTLPLQQCCCRLLFKFGHFDAIIRRATLIVFQNPCRNHCGPIWRFLERRPRPCMIFYTFLPGLSIAKNGKCEKDTREYIIMKEKELQIIIFFAILLHTSQFYDKM